MNRERDCIIISCIECALQFNDVDYMLHHCHSLYCLTVNDSSLRIFEAYETKLRHIIRIVVTLNGIDND